MTPRTFNLFCRHLPAIACVVVVIAGCGTADGGQPITESNSVKDVAATDVVTKDAPLVASCMGTALLDQFAAFDYECAFLAVCAGAGKCYCGKPSACGTKSPLCNADVCTGVGTTCYCGDGCKSQPTKVPVCPSAICDPSKLDMKACNPMDYCPFVGKEPPATCGCTTMADHEPDCWCGTPCDAKYPRCSDTVCTTKDPAKCIVVPGKPLQGFHCATCGLLGNAPKCFFIQSH